MQAEALGEMFPQAPVHTLVHDPELYTGGLASHELRVSFIDRLPFARRRYRAYLPLFPLAVEQFDLRGHELVLSSCHAVAKGVLTGADQLHVCYCHTPIRYVWDLYLTYLEDARLTRGLRSALARVLLHRLRAWDFQAAQRVDVFVANSHCVRRRIAKTYRRAAHVVHPGVAVERFRPQTRRDDFYLVVSRLVPYKRVELICEAFTAMNKPLIVIGDGPLRDRVERSAGPSVRLLGHLPDEAVADHMQRCRAFVFAADEDFGMVSVEAQAAGAPVIALGRSGSLETVAPGLSGLFFPEQTVDSIRQAVLSFEAQPDAFDPLRIAERAQAFSFARYKSEMARIIDRALDLRSRDLPVEPPHQPQAVS
jgi:glycosyltransferase involved in cell wall biosynthesis